MSDTPTFDRGLSHIALVVREMEGADGAQVEEGGEQLAVGHGRRLTRQRLPLVAAESAGEAERAVL